MKILPNNPSELIRVALDDLAKVEKLPITYNVDMMAWHIKRDRYIKCTVCFAGAVIAMSLGRSPTQTYFPESFSEEISRKLRALDYFRNGDISRGMVALGCDFEQRKIARRALGLKSEDDEYPVPRYEDGRRAFKTALRRMASKLAEQGL